MRCPETSACLPVTLVPHLRRQGLPTQTATKMAHPEPVIQATARKVIPDQIPDLTPEVIRVQGQDRMRALGRVPGLGRARELVRARVVARVRAAQSDIYPFPRSIELVGGALWGAFADSEGASC